MFVDKCDRRVIHEDQVERARALLPSQEVIDEMSRLFKAINDPGRLKVLMALNRLEMCVCDLAALLGVTESAASHQMRILREARLVKSRRDGQVLYYHLIDDHVVQVIEVAQAHTVEPVG